ncbi:MAG: HNH endonuclease [Deltaproteobacteria bacterium]|nr:HNH endonuclease [Deltaproteobacteria bacterium]
MFIAAFSQLHVARALGEHGTQMVAPLPPGAAAGRTVVDIPSLHRLVRRAFQLSRTLPDELLHAFEKQTAALPRTTEAERLVVQRVGQDLFRAGLIEYWEGRCAITGLDVVELLRASHIKPWADCDSDAERLDVYNGLLLAPHLDAAFDRGFITVADDGAIVVSARLDSGQRAILGLAVPLRLKTLASTHRGYLDWHRERVFTQEQ